MKHFNIFNFQGVSESREVVRGPKDPPFPGPNRVKISWKQQKIFHNYTGITERKIFSAPLHLCRGISPKGAVFFPWVIFPSLYSDKQKNGFFFSSFWLYFYCVEYCFELMFLFQISILKNKGYGQIIYEYMSVQVLHKHISGDPKKL